MQFRVALGLLLVWDAYRHLVEGWPVRLYVEPGLLFHYEGFAWLRPLSGAGMTAWFYGLAALGACVAVGFRYRAAAALLCVGWAYPFLLDQAEYLNHMYLVVLVTGLMAFLPAHGALSVDAALRPGLRSDAVPRWTLALLRTQVGLVYFFGGVAKLNPDWLSGVPMQLMLLERHDLLGQAAGEPTVALLFAYGGLAFDLLIVPALWWRPTRVPALLAAAGFHLANHVLFNIGLFPWFMLAATLILWPPLPLTPLRFGRLYAPLVGIGLLLAWSVGRIVPPWSWAVLAGVAYLLTFPPDWLKHLHDGEVVDPTVAERGRPAPPAVPPRVRPAVLTLLTLYLGWQCLMPLRHWAYPGDVSWTEEGHKWSWHMKLRRKRVAQAVFYVHAGDGRTIDVHPLAPGGRSRSARPARWRRGRISPCSSPIGWPATRRRTACRRRSASPPTCRSASTAARPNRCSTPPSICRASKRPSGPPAGWILPLTAPPPPLERVDVSRLGREEAADDVE